MTNGDLFFSIFLGTITAIRFFIYIRKNPGPIIMGIKIRHYMEGIILIILAFVIHDITLFALGSGLFIDEVPLILVKGPGRKDAEWNFGADYNESWCSTSVFVLVFVVYLLRNTLAGWI